VMSPVLTIFMVGACDGRLGSEYVFHSRPPEARAPMDAATLAAWYERMLFRCQEARIVSRVEPLEDHVAGLQSVRDFPLFDGDFFPDRLAGVIEKGKQPPPPPPRGKGGKMPLARSETLAIADEMRREVTTSKYAFLVATLRKVSDPRSSGREKQIGAHELVDDRERFLEMCISRHWQFDELRRAQYSTMMMIAVLGGAPE